MTRRQWSAMVLRAWIVVGWVFVIPAWFYFGCPL